MCGIVGAYLRQGSVAEGLLKGLATLEYRGYDSAGLGLLVGERVVVRKKEGRLSELEQLLRQDPLPPSPIGVGHTRWATHGEPSDVNAHPHSDQGGNLALVHNGIIENYLELRPELETAGVVLKSETDTELLAHLIGRELGRGRTPREAVLAALSRVRGYYAMAVLVGGPEPALFCSRQGPPLLIGRSPAGAFLGSDILALLPHTRDMIALEDGDVAQLTPDRLEIWNARGEGVERPVRHIEWDAEAVDKGGYAHFMLKEIHEQPAVLARTLSGRLESSSGDADLGEAFSDRALADVQRIQVVACGTALHAGYVARYLIEGLAGVPVDLDYASEFRYRKPVLAPGTLALAISQSGETADTLAALRLCKELGARAATICNVVGSSMVREAEAVLMTDAGPEIGVASTKAFLAQCAASVLLALRLGRAKRWLSVEQGRALIEELRLLRPKLESMLSEERVAALRQLADRHRNVKGFLFLGRGINFPIALEGALKLKEISYMHAEGYPAGEMKHGPIALVEPDMTTVVVSSVGAVAEKSRSNIEQVKARGGRVIVVGSDLESQRIAQESIPVPETSEWLSPLLNVVPLQLLAYHIADLRGCDIDKPRNLAKSVTVE
jgi:glucosamine--fructose-6-phosphate aminotransferase (isomerizing)